MTKDEAIHKALKVLNCLNNDRVYETAWVKGAIQACKEALKQPLTRDWKETIDERIAKDDEFKRALEPVAWIIQTQKIDGEPTEPYAMMGKYKYVADTCDFGEPIPLYTHLAPLWQGNKEFVGLSDDEILEIDKSIDPKIIIGKGKTLFARAIEQALRNKNGY